MLDITTTYIIGTLWGLGFIAILMVGVWVGHQNYAVLVNMPCPVCRRPFGKKVVKQAIQKAQEMNNAEVAKRANDDLFSKDTYTRPTPIPKWPVQCPVCGTQYRYYPFDPLMHRGWKLKRLLFPLNRETSFYEKSGPSKI